MSIPFHFHLDFEQYLDSLYYHNIQFCTCTLCTFCEERDSIYLRNISNILHIMKGKSRENQFQGILYILRKMIENPEFYQDSPFYLFTCDLMIDNMKKLINENIIMDDWYKEYCFQCIQNYEKYFPIHK